MGDVPSATPKAADPTADLFGPEPTKTPEPTPPAETPAAPPATPPATPPADAPADDLFGPSTPATPPAATPDAPPADKPAETPAENKDEKKAADDIFGNAPSILREAGGLASSEMRTWIDNTGNFSCQGRMVRFADGNVKLLKENGRTSTVPVARLSASDAEFVHRQASAQQSGLFQTAQSLSAIPLLTN
jgi:hypothetical protein